MFFNKPNNTNPIIIRKKISVLGNSSTALYIASVFQKIGHDVTIICQPSYAHKNIDVTIKNSAKLLSEHHKINTSFELSSSPDFLFIASEIPNLYSDLLLISSAKITDTTIISLTPTAETDFISQSLKQKSICAYLDTWLNHKGDSICLNTNSPQITLSLPTDAPEAKAIQNVFHFSEIELIFKDSPAENFWNWFAPRILLYFINIAMETNTNELSKTSEGRTLLDNCLNEISLLAYQDKTTLNKNNVLSSLYSAPLNLFSTKELSSSYLQRTSLKLISLLFGKTSSIDNHFPTLKNLVNKTFNIS